ncbi:hypothetical protein C9374_004359 [Naegleria lovaniensis]|uniref:VPS9 domain-containing protein n=1 Tax=Naegleria lovaniensis TaxID=51637 RepID=A0AA88KL13_NAELO|nr:uncharacterized protein C9374_004359 [Naegleria lovaniensis]KAG2383688.1 hypothetical protein C9374_004359 [Naegleria lovaniensis]
MLKKFFGSTADNKKDLEHFAMKDLHDDDFSSPNTSSPSRNTDSPTNSTNIKTFNNNNNNNNNNSNNKTTSPFSPRTTTPLPSQQSTSSLHQLPPTISTTNAKSYTSTPTTATTPSDLQRRISLALTSSQQQKESPTAAHILLTERGASMLHLSAHHHRNSSLSSLLDSNGKLLESLSMGEEDQSLGNNQTINSTVSNLNVPELVGIAPTSPDLLEAFVAESDSDDEESQTPSGTAPNSSNENVNHDISTPVLRVDHTSTTYSPEQNSSAGASVQRQLPGTSSLSGLTVTSRTSSKEALASVISPATPMSARSLASMLDQFMDDHLASPNTSSVMMVESGERRLSLDETQSSSASSRLEIEPVVPRASLDHSSVGVTKNHTPKIHGSAYNNQASEELPNSSPLLSNSGSMTSSLQLPVPLKHKRTKSVDSSHQQTPLEKASPTLTKTPTTTNVLNIAKTPNKFAASQNESPIYKSFKFTDEEGKEYHYQGTVLASTNEMHGRGELLYPNKTIYEGDFDKGKKHGFGKIIFPSTIPKKPPTIAIGQWNNDVPSSELPWKISYDGEEMEYWGYVKLKTKSVGKIMYTLDDFERTQEGELYCSKTNTKYFGSFKHNQKYGFGVEIYPTIAERYCGGWKHDMYHYFGTYHYRDGTYFQGMYKKGQRKGKGKLYLPNGDIIEGFWYGDSKVEGCTYYKGTCKNVQLTNLHMLQFQIQESMKLYENMGHMDELAMSMYDPECVKPASDLKWTQYLVLFRDDWKKERYALSKKLLLTGTFSDISASTSDPSFKFVSNFIAFFVSIFCGSYYIGSNSKSVSGKHQATLLYHAIDDTKSFIMFLCDKVLWDFFVRDVFSVALTADVANSEQLLVDIEKEFYPICRNLISNTVHEKLFSTLFELYNYHYRDSDLLMNQKVRSLQGCTISMFGVAPEFAPLPPSDMNLVFYEYKQTSDTPYEDTIKLLDQIRNAKSVIAKIETLSKVRTHAMQTMKKYRKAHKRKEAYLNYQSSNDVYDMDRNTKPVTKEPWWNAELEKRCEEWQAGADDVTSVYSYIFSKSSIDNFTATFHYVNDWKSEQVNFDPVSHIIRFYEGYLSYIQDIDPNILHEGQFISKYSLTSSLESAIEGRIIFYRDKNLPFFWLPSLLVHVGLEIGKTIANSAAAITKSSSLSLSNIANITNITAGSILNLLASLNPTTAMNSAKNESPQESKPNVNFNPFTRKLTLPSNLEVVDISNQNLVQSIIKFNDLVRQTLGASSIGFNVELKKNEETGNNDVVVAFDKIYPSYVYSDIALGVTRYIKYEIQNIIIV